MMDQRTATALAARDYHFDPVAGQQADGRLVDRWIQHPLGATGHQRHAAAPGAMHREQLGSVHRGRPAQPPRRQPHQRTQPPRHEFGERPRQQGADQRYAEQEGPRQHQRQHGSQHAFAQGAAVCPFNMGAADVDQMHVMHPRRAGRHATEAGQATVDMRDHRRRRGAVFLQHVLDLVNPAAGAVQLVAAQHIGRAGREAETAMDASAQDFIGDLDVGIGELFRGEIRLHRRACSVTQISAYMRPGLRMPFGSKAAFTRCASRVLAPGWGWKTGILRLISSGARNSVA